MLRHCKTTIIDSDISVMKYQSCCLGCCISRLIIITHEKSQYFKQHFSNFGQKVLTFFKKIKVFSACFDMAGHLLNCQCIKNSNFETVCRKCIYKKLSVEEIESCPVCNIDLGCVPEEKLRLVSHPNNQNFKP